MKISKIIQGLQKYSLQKWIWYLLPYLKKNSLFQAGTPGQSSLRYRRGGKVQNSESILKQVIWENGLKNESWILCFWISTEDNIKFWEHSLIVILDDVLNQGSFSEHTFHTIYCILYKKCILYILFVWCSLLFLFLTSDILIKETHEEASQNESKSK